MQLGLARTLAWAGGTAEAREIYGALLLVDPADLEATLGLIELQAWRGETQAAIDGAVRLVTREPKSPAARTLLGDVYRWEWRMREASEQYEAALDLESEYGPAIDGVRAVRSMRAVRLEPQGYRFTDSRDFEQRMVGLAGRFPFGRAVVSVQFEEWRFRAGDAPPTSRRDAGMALGYRFGRSLEMQGGMTVFRTSGADTSVSPRLSAKWSPAGAVDLYASGAFRVPVTDSILTVRRGLVGDAGGLGLDAALGEGASIQLSAGVSSYSDDNRRSALSAQMSYQIPGPLQSVVRLQFERLAFSEARADYFTPSRFHVVRPMFEAEPRVSDAVAFVFKAEVPFVLTEDDVGSGITAGVRLGQPSGLQGEVVFFRHRVPGGADVWSGNGLRVAFSIGIGQ
jgi:hypothetical protein